MKKKVKRVVAFMLALAMAWLPVSGDTGLLQVMAEGDNEEENIAQLSEEGTATVSKIADFTFDDITNAGDEISGGSAKATGTYSLVESYYADSKALSLDGKSQYISITDSEGASLLAGLDEMTFSMDVKFVGTSTPWLFYAAPNTDSQTYKSEKYIGCFLNGGKTLTAERYNSNNIDRPVAATYTQSVGQWIHIDVVYTAEDTELYVDGDKVSTAASSVDISDMLGENGILYIGKANWGSGEYGNLVVDNLQIYNGVLDADAISNLYNEYKARKTTVVADSDLSLNLGYVSADFTLPETSDDQTITWTSNSSAIVIDGTKATVTRADANQNVTLTAAFGTGESAVTKDFNLVVLATGSDLITYVSNAPATGQTGGMKIATADGALHKDQPILYTTLGNKAYVSPAIMRAADGKSFYMVAADGSASELIFYTTSDLITYSNETTIDTGTVSGIKKVAAVYDMADARYEIYLENSDGDYVITSSDMATFTAPERCNYSFTSVSAPSDATFASAIGLTTAEYEKVVEKFTNPYNTSVTSTPTDTITVTAGTTEEEFEETLTKYLEGKTVSATYSDGTNKTYSLRFTDESVENVDLDSAGEYTLTGVIGGSANYTDAEDELILERADPYVVYNEDDGYYYFTASYPMDYSGDADGYDRIILRRAKTIEGLDDAEEVTIWDENESASLGRFIWAPEMHKIGDSWYLVATAGLNTGSGTTFNIRPFMIKFNGDASKDNMLDPDNWGDPELVKAASGDTANVLAGMSLDMTYFESNGTSYLIWADETKSTTNPNGLSYLYIATIDPSDPTQLTSTAKLLTAPEYAWEQVTYKVNEGPGVFHNNGKVYMTFSASGTGSEYCVGLMYADETADLTDASNWTKLPYPILTSSDFDNEVSGPGHNSFTTDENGNLVIVYHARVTASHSSHTGDSLYDPCRNTYVKTVFFDEDGLPIFNMSDDEFISGGDTFSVKVLVTGETVTAQPVLEYDFDEDYTEGVAKNTATDADGKTIEGIDAKLVNGATYVEDDDYGQVLYLDGGTGFGGTNSYLEFPEGFFDGKDKMTISFDVNQVTRSGNYFTFALGEDSTNYLFYKALATGEKLAITNTSYSNEKTVTASSAYPNTSRTWINIKIVMNGDKMSLYRDGKLIGTNKNTGVSISDLGENLLGYLGKSFYSSDDYFRGYFDNIKVYDKAFTASEVSSAYASEEAKRLEEIGDIDYIADNYEIPDQDEITDNITLLSEENGVSISWKSSNESIISTEVVKNDNYDDTPAGVVTRPSQDTVVTLTATFTKGTEIRTKEFKCTVKAAKTQDDEYVGYLFVHFKGTQQTADMEQMYFSISKDGLNWTDLNDNEPVMESTIGESGLRDMYIARSANGDKFYMISTDLSIYHYSSWGEAGSNGSHSIVVWESDDLVNWSDPWLAEIAPENAGCTWAPEFIYDEKTGEYIVYWSSTTLEVDDDEKITQEYENHSIYYCKTRDFKTFTEPQLFKQGDTVNGTQIKVIDSTMIQGEDGKYYRYTKNESYGTIEIEVADSVLGDYTEIKSESIQTTLKNKVGSVEGPIIFKMNDKSEDGKTQYCLLTDRFASSKGYYPVITTDLSSGEFTFLDDDDLGSFKNSDSSTAYRHGYVMPITAKEYAALANEDWEEFDDAKEVTLDKSTGNPFLGFDENGDILYGGDPSVLVDGDTVYAYVGHDTSSTESYYMPDWRCYSSKDMVNWTYEGQIMSDSDVSWCKDKTSAWAGQVVKYGDKYYFYYCTEATSAYGGGKCLGVAVSDSPTGGFVDIGKPLVRNIDTYNGVSTWEDIDPTFWIETDENGVEHRILGWGNVRFFNCELNEDMISIKDQDGDTSKLTCETAADNANADIKVGVINGMPSGHQYTEAPWYYKHTLADGTTRYYMFFAYDWREQMAYAYCDSLEDFLNNVWTFGGVVMEPSATGNTNHMAVFDFNGSTYFVYHDGSLPHGSGFRRVACVEEFEVNEDGTIPYIRKTATGLTGTSSKITDVNGNYIASETFENTLDDDDYPMTDKEILCDFYQDGEESEWMITAGMSNKTKDSFVSIESNYKPGLYLTVGDIRDDGTYDVVLAQNVNGTKDEAKSMTFRTIEGMNGSGVTFESVLYHGYYLASVDGDIILTKNPTADSASFNVTAYKDAEGDDVVTAKVTSARVEKTTRLYTLGQTFTTSDMRIRATLDNGKTVTISDYTVDADDIDMTTTGAKTLKVNYKYGDESYQATVSIRVVDKAYRK